MYFPIATILSTNACVVKLVSTQDLKSCAVRLTGSSPVTGTMNMHICPNGKVFRCKRNVQGFDSSYVFQNLKTLLFGYLEKDSVKAVV